ncbi:predicted protein [Postia placenta Mad-698-R]|nr:predicted protein [Postia placenta Mad-698-R]
MAEEAFNCTGLEHVFDAVDKVDVAQFAEPNSLFYNCDKQLCPNRTPRSITVEEGHFIPIRRIQHPLGPRSQYASRSISHHVTPIPSQPASPGTRIPQPVAGTATPQAISQPSLGPRLERNPKPEPCDTPAYSGASSSSVVTSSTPVPVVPHPTSGLSPVPSPSWPPRGRSHTRSPQSLPGRQPQPPPPPPGHSPSPPLPVMSSPTTAPDKETLKLLLPLRYDGKTIIECDRFLSQLRIYWMVNMSLTTIKLKATPYFAQLASVQVGIQGVVTPFADEAAFAAAFRAHFSNLDDEAAVQIELAKLCVDKSVREKCTAAEFSALFKGPADHSGYGDLELRDKYLSGIPSRVYRKIELETFTTWEDADKHATEVKQILDISRAHQPELNNFFSSQGRGQGGVRGGAPQTHGALASINVAVGKGNFPGSCFGCGK